MSGLEPVASTTADVRLGAEPTHPIVDVASPLAFFDCTSSAIFSIVSKWSAVISPGSMEIANSLSRKSASFSVANESRIRS